MTSWPALGDGTLVAVHAHPDDEALWTGGLLAAWSAAGGRTVVVTATRGEQGETIGDSLAPAEGDIEAMRGLRRGELRSSLQALGVARGCFLDEFSIPPTTWSDSGMTWGSGTEVVAAPGAVVAPTGLVHAERAALATALATIVETERPTLVATYGPDGGYGHPDHRLVSALTTQVARDHAAPVAWRSVSAADAALMRSVSDTIWRADAAAYAQRTGHRRAITGPAHVLPTTDLPNTDLPNTDGPSDGLRVDVRPVRGSVLAALRAHRSQVQAVREWADQGRAVASYALSDGRVRVLLDTEEYVAATPASDEAQPGAVA